jgi:NADH-quinone oxidoreductase subunit K
MSAIALQQYLLVSAALFSLGVYGVLARRNAIGILMGVELMLNAANVNFLAFWRYIAPVRFEGQVFVLIVITAAAAEVAVGLALILAIHRHFRTIDVDEIHTMRG